MSYVDQQSHLPVGSPCVTFSSKCFPRPHSRSSFRNHQQTSRSLGLCILLVPRVQSTKSSSLDFPHFLLEAHNSAVPHSSTAFTPLSSAFSQCF